MELKFDYNLKECHKQVLDKNLIISYVNGDNRESKEWILFEKIDEIYKMEDSKSNKSYSAESKDWEEFKKQVVNYFRSFKC